MRKAEREPIIDLRTTNVGMSCDDYTLLVVAGPPSRDLSPRVQRRINMHVKVCSYHNSKGFRQSMLETHVTRELETSALEVVKKLSVLPRDRS